eukprot:6429245-Prymnesium_polylepis.2
MLPVAFPLSVCRLPIAHTDAEYTDVRDWHFENIYFKELFDLKADPFQLTNLISATALGVQEQLHQALRREFTCKGGGCQW